jgi:hypothetical protein
MNASRTRRRLNFHARQTWRRLAPYLRQRLLYGDFHDIISHARTNIAGNAGGGFNRRGCTVEQCRAGIARTRRGHGDGKPPHPDGDGRSRLWHVGDNRRRRIDRCGTQAPPRKVKRFPAKHALGLDRGWRLVRVKETRQIENPEPRSDSIGTEKALAGPPLAVHARGDDRAARPVLPHVMRGAIAHGVGAGVVARVDVGRPFLLPIDRHAPQRPPALRGHVRDGRLRRRRGPQLRRYRLRLRHRTGEQEPGKSTPNCDRHNPFHLKSTHA